MCKRIVLITGILIFTLVTNFHAQEWSQVQADYIAKYKDIAIREMQRASIPASITLAQGLLESESGQSRLATQGNNHFGLKCGNDWYGEIIFKEDDDYDQNGDLIASCFRKYPTVEESFVAHSNFLRHPNKPWYLPLFDLEITDYKGWAKGLQAAGYATNPKYPQLLISLIERYQLNQYDIGRPLVSFDDLGDEKLYINGLPYTFAQAGETVGSIAFRTKISSRHLLKFNDGLFDGNQKLEAGQIVFLKQKKWNNMEEENPFHKVKKGETMLDLSQKYGISLFWLNFKNKMKEGLEPAVGSLIKIRGTRVEYRPLLATDKETLYKPKEDYIVWTTEPHQNPLHPVIHELPDRAALPKVATQEGKTATPRVYVVKKGDTLWRISQQFNLTVAALMRINNLSGNIISIGQELKIE